MSSGAGHTEDQPEIIFAGLVWCPENGVFLWVPALASAVADSDQGNQAVLSRFIRVLIPETLQGQGKQKGGRCANKKIFLWGEAHASPSPKPFAWQRKQLSLYKPGRAFSAALANHL